MQVNLKIYGRVQGVLFRRYTKAEAERLGLNGWVRNKEDGSVEALAQGSEAKIDEFVKWCKKGPSLAKVERVEVKEIKTEEIFEGFEIR